MSRLPLARKPEIVRLHELEHLQRNRYISEFSNCLQQFLPEKLWEYLPLLGDIYYTYTTICLCRRRLGEEYTYVAMFNKQHYEQQGVLLNSKTRLLMFILEIMQRYFLRIFMRKIWVKMQQKVERVGNLRVWREFVGLGVEGVLEEGRMFMVMLFFLGWNKHYNLIDTILKNEYIYTYFNKSNQQVNYKIEGYMLLIVLIVRILKFAYKASKSVPKKQKPQQMKIQDEKKPQQDGEQEQLCRICYDNIKDKSITCCGHVFCWDCIVRYLGTNPQCPVCRTACEARQIVQLQNY